MAIRTVITRGYGNGTFNGTIPLVVTRGYTISTVVPFVVPFSILATMQTIQGHLMASGRFVSVELGQPSTVATGPKMSAAIWLESIQVGTVFLGVVDKVYEVTIRLYRDMLAEPQELAELDLA